ncbi:353 kDa protein fiber [Human adenovirus 55]|uniref:353 kDa protein fiber n=1 Tax=Human adenovirus 55 TaxID=714978 RepID=A0A075FDI3_9ADEN|nr:353 kDa protein fiber [Human adenovirus 55]
MTKRVRLSDSFNPVYPYEDESTSQHPFINPGFISPNGFTQSPDGVLTLKCLTPLTTTGGSLQLKVGGGLTVDDTDGTLQENIGTTTPLVKTGHSIGLSLGAGLGTDENKLCTKLGKGLTFNSNNICIDDNINTLWTGINPTEANCQMMDSSESNDCKLILTLVKTGALVTAFVYVIGVSNNFNMLTTYRNINFTAELFFDSAGNLLTSLSSLKTPLNHKSGQNMALVPLLMLKVSCPAQLLILSIIILEKKKTTFTEPVTTQLVITLLFPLTYLSCLTKEQ